MKPSKDPKTALIEKTAREFARKTLLPDIHETDRCPYGPVFDDALKIAHESEFLHIALPEELDGMGRKLMPLCTLLQNISETDASMGAIILTHSAAQELMLAAGATDLLEKTVSADIAAADFMISFPLFDHPDEMMLHTSAKGHNGSHELTGSTEYVVLGAMAARCIVPARTARGYSYFLLDRKADGFAVSAPVKGLGLRACPAVDVTLSAAEGIMIGAEDEGASLFSKMQEKMIIASAAVAFGIMKSSFQDARAYAAKRLQGGRKIMDWSELSGMLGQMAIKTKTADMLLSKAVADADASIPGWEAQGYAAASKILADACTVTSLGLQVFGGYGYMRDYLQEKRYRDARHLQSVFGSPGRRAIHFMKQYNKIK